MEVALPEKEAARIRRAAAGAWPEECCGLLTGRVSTETIAVARAHPSANLAAHAATAFEIDPRLWLALRREAESGADAVVGLYHSHPAGPAAPSAADRAEAWGAGMAWLIVAMADGAVADLAAWIFEDGRGFQPAALRIAGPQNT